MLFHTHIHTKGFRVGFPTQQTKGQTHVRIGLHAYPSFCFNFKKASLRLAIQFLLILYFGSSLLTFFIYQRNYRN